MTYEFERYVTDASGVRTTLDKFGVAIIPSVLNADECQAFEDGMWAFFERIAADWEKPFKRDDPSTWRGIYDLCPEHSMLFQRWGIGHDQSIWDVRQNPRVVAIFAAIWGTHDLVVSFDAASFHLPPEVTGRGFAHKSRGWMHTDQSYCRNDFECIQSWITALDVNAGDATLHFLEGSHRFHGAVAAAHEITERKDWYKCDQAMLDTYAGFGCEPKKIKCPRGSLVLWDSRTIHCGVESMQNRARATERICAYLCYMPRAQCSERVLAKKRKAFAELRMSSHNVTRARLFSKTPQTYGRKLPTVRAIEPPVLTELGQRLAGF